MKKVIIYTLSSSRNSDNIKYVGKTTQSVRRRLLGHLTNAKRAKRLEICTNHNLNWINHEIELGHKIIAEELDSIYFNDDEDWSWLEIYWIEQIKIWGFNLTNIRKGGEDNHYTMPNEEVVRKRAKHFIGKPRDGKTKQAISKGLTGKKLSKETKKKISQSIIRKQGRPVLLFKKDGTFIREWPASSMAVKEIGGNKSNLFRCCNGKRKSYKGFIWKYITKEIKERKIVLLSLNGKFINEFINSFEAAKQLKIDAILINRVCNGLLPLTYNYIFKYHNDYYT